MRWGHKHVFFVSRKAKAFLESTIMGHHFELCPFLSGKRKLGQGEHKKNLCLNLFWGTWLKAHLLADPTYFSSPSRGYGPLRSSYDFRSACTFSLSPLWAQPDSATLAIRWAWNLHISSIHSIQVWRKAQERYILGLHFSWSPWAGDQEKCDCTLGLWGSRGNKKWPCLDSIYR